VTPTIRKPWVIRSRIVYPTVRWVVHTTLKITCRLRLHGHEQLPAGGPLILVANHQSYLDPFMLGAGIHLRPHYLVWTAFMRMPLIGTFCRLFGGLEVGHGPPARSLRAARQALAGGDVLEIFPEGGRSPDGSVLPFARGFAQLARVSGAGVLPAAIVGADAVWPPARMLPRPGHVEIYYGEVMHAEAPADLTGEKAREADRLFARRVRRAVLDVSRGRLQAALEPASGVGRPLEEPG
jgi:1-acyl-sn-glycerol-3-phosphate acyltransferase